MSAKTFKISYSLVFIILIALYVGLFFVFGTWPFSAQQWFFLVLIPFILAIDCAAGIVLSGLKDFDITLVASVPVAKLQIIYSVAAAGAGMLFALAGASMKNQIVAQAVLFSILLIAYVVSFYVSSHVAGVKKKQQAVKLVDVVKDEFRLAVAAMEHAGLDDGRRADLSRLCDDFVHAAPCNDAQAMSIESQISEELQQLMAEGPEGFDKHYSKVRFLVKRRSLLRSR